jgi:hypothetical protein
VKKYCTAGPAAEDNMTDSNFMLDNKGYRHKLRICNIYCCSTATMVARQIKNIMFMRKLPFIIFAWKANGNALSDVKFSVHKLHLAHTSSIYFIILLLSCVRIHIIRPELSPRD